MSTNVKRWTTHLVVTILTCALIPLSNALAVESGGVGGRPAYPDSNIPRTESIFIFSGNPGDNIENGVKVFNNSSQIKTVEVYATDSAVSNDGAFACSQKLDEQRQVGTWVKLAQQKIELQPSENRIIPFTVSLPDSVSPGEHNGCIIMQEADQTPQSVGGGIALSFRSGIRMSITVNGEIKKGLSFEKLESHVSEGNSKKRVITTTLHNTGNVSLDVDIQAKLSSPFGRTVREAGDEFPVTPDELVSLNFEVDELFWGGFYRLEAIANYNGNLEEIIGSPDKDTTIHSDKSLIFVMLNPVAMVVELAVLALLVVGIYFLCTRLTTQRKWQKDGKTYIIKSGDNLQQIAERFGVNWKLVARVNKLRAPYTVRPGQRIKILTKKDIPKVARRRETQCSRL